MLSLMRTFFTVLENATNVWKRATCATQFFNSDEPICPTQTAMKINLPSRSNVKIKPLGYAVRLQRQFPYFNS